MIFLALIYLAFISLGLPDSLLGSSWPLMHLSFGVPVGSWPRGPLRPWAEDLLSEARLQREGFFNPAPIRKKWAEFLSGQRNWQHPLWCVLMFQAWLAEQGLSPSMAMPLLTHLPGSMSKWPMASKAVP